MAFDTQSEQTNLRGVFYDKTIKGIANQTYKFKQAVTIVSTSAWTNFYFRENNAVLTGASGNSIAGIPRGAEFPMASASWERVSAVISKYGLQDTITYEDLISDQITIRDRVLFKIGEGVAKSVDDAIWDALTENRIAVNIGSYAIVAGYQWDAASAAIIDDLLRAKQTIAENNYDTSDLMLFVSPKDYRSIINYIAQKGSQFPVLGADAASNGNMGRLAGINIVVSNSVTADYALVVVPKRCATWSELVPLTTITKEDQLKDTTIRAAELGVLSVTDPKAVFLLSNTQA